MTPQALPSEANPTSQSRFRTLRAAWAFAAVLAAPGHAWDVAGVVDSAPNDPTRGSNGFEVVSYYVVRGEREPDQAVYRPHASEADMRALFSVGLEVGRLEEASDRRNLDSAFFYYAGIGVPGPDGAPHLVTANGGGLVALDDVFSGMQRLGARHAIVVLEADVDAARIQPPDGVTVVLAAQPGETARRDPATGMGLFTAAVLTGASDVADSDADGVLTAGEATDFARFALQTWRDDHPGTPGQTPLVIGDARAPLLPAAATPWRFPSLEGEAGDPLLDWLDRSVALWLETGGADPLRREELVRTSEAAVPAFAPTPPPTGAATSARSARAGPEQALSAQTGAAATSTPAATAAPPSHAAPTPPPRPAPARPAQTESETAATPEPCVARHLAWRRRAC